MMTNKELEEPADRRTVRAALVHWYSKEQELEDPYYRSIRLGVERSCKERGIELTEYFRLGRDEISMDPVDGIVAIGKFSPEQIARINRCTDNIVFVDSAPNDDKFDAVVVDFVSAVDGALGYLWREGHRRIGYIGGREYIGSQNLAVVEKRDRVYTMFMQQRDAFNRDDVYLGSFLAESGYQLMREALRKESVPTAFFVASDSMAIGAMRAAQESGYRIPDDISIVSFNDIDAARETTPPLTTVRIHKERMGEIAVDLLLDHLGRGEFIPRKVIVSSKLIVRGSVSRIEPE